MPYCLRNVGKEPVNALGIVIAPGKTSRLLTEAEIKLAWQSELDSNVKLEPIVMEGAGVSQPTTGPATAFVNEEVAGQAKLTGRRKKLEQD